MRTATTSIGIVAKNVRLVATFIFLKLLKNPFPFDAILVYPKIINQVYQEAEETIFFAASSSAVKNGIIFSMMRFFIISSSLFL